MFNSHRNVFSTLILSLALAAGTAHAANASDYGIAANATSAARQIELRPGSGSVNVTNGETVRFVVGNESFVWHFATLRDETNFELAEIAPKGWPLPGVRVYVASNPIYRG